MTIIGIAIIDDAIKKHADSRIPLQSWLAEAKEAEWNNSQDIKKMYRTASFLSGNRVIFNIGGKKYRLAVQLAYKVGIVRILWFGTHAEYSKKEF
jgi:mRNA interferase HigB